MNDLPVPADRAGSLLQQIERLIRSDIDPAKIQSVLDLYNQERDRAQTEAFNRDLAALQGEVFAVAAKGTNPTFRSAYPKMETLVAETREYLNRHGISIRFGMTLQKTEAPPPEKGMVRVVEIVSHRDGHWEEHYIDAPPDMPIPGRSGREAPRTPIQSVGSTITYLKRYMYQMTLNLVTGVDPHDNDGEGHRGDMRITPEQQEEIAMLIAGWGHDEVAELMKFMGVASFADIQERDFVRYCNNIIARNKRVSGESNGEN